MITSFELADRYLKPYRQNGDEIYARYCPFCGGGQRKDKYTFCFNVRKETYICHRGKCGEKGTFRQLARYFGEEAEMRGYEIPSKPKKQYKKPKIETSKLSKKAIEYAGKRKISQQTLKDWKVEEKNKNIVFKYFDENNELVFVKYRPAKKLKKGERKAWREKDGKPILYGMWLIDKDKPLVITEGEFDALAVYEAGYKNVVSVPSGNKDFTWVDTCWDWLQDIQKIIIWGDNDEPGREMVKKLIPKLGEEKCFLVETKYKDANEMLYREGKDAVIETVNNAKPVPLEGLIDLADVKPVNDSDLPKIKSNIKWIDKFCGGWIMGELSVWTGKRGEGKSTFLGQVLLEAVNEGNSVCAYSGELTAQRFQNWIHLQAAGPKNIEYVEDKVTGKQYPKISREIHEKIRNWYRGKIFLYDNTINFENTEENSIIKVFTYAVKRYDCRLFLVDNLMTARFDGINERDYYRRQSEFVGELVRFAKSFNVHVHLVAHPKKTKDDLDNDSISGTGDIPNRADNVFAIKKVSEEENYDTELTVLKLRGDGRYIGESIGLCFDVKSRRFYEPSQPENRVKKYGWQDMEYLEDLDIPEDCPF